MLVCRRNDLPDRSTEPCAPAMRRLPRYPPDRTTKKRTPSDHAAPGHMKWHAARRGLSREGKGSEETPGKLVRPPGPK